jgi:hypothetical protein
VVGTPRPPPSSESSDALDDASSSPPPEDDASCLGRDSFFSSDASCFGGNRLYEGRRKQDAGVAAGAGDGELTEKNNW